MKKFYPILIIALGFQVDHINPVIIQPFEKYKADKAHLNVRLFTIEMRRREIKLISDGNNF